MNDYFSAFRTFHHYQENIEQNFDVSVVMPFYKKLNAFKRVFPKNQKYFERNGIEVIIVLDCPDEKDLLLQYIQKYPFINWKVAYNDKPHDWRNPTKPINVGIRFSTKQYIMVCSPESEFYTDAILQLRTRLEDYPKHYAIGNVCFADNDAVIDDRNIDYYHFLNYGSIMVKKSHLYNINAYDETLNRWGGDDDNIRARLELAGVEELFMPDVKLIHRDNHTAGNARRMAPLDILEELRYPKKTIVNDSWGEDFDTLIYNWQDNVYAEKLLKQYMSSFVQYELKPKSLEKNYDRILLLPTYNEKKNILRCLKENAGYFDAIILLDDESSDSTYEMALHDKLVLKIKKRRDGFNDLENRNILLNAVSFFKHRWVCFIDADEIIDPRYANFNFFSDQENIDSVLINIVHLWDNENSYNYNYPYTYKGIGLKYRMFRNIGHTQILSKEGKLHFIPIPYTANAYHSPILIRHYGHLEENERKRKYAFYMQEDTEHCQTNYNHLIEENIQKGIIDHITNKHLEEAMYIYFK